ncbi:hypothetical protein BT63DRAFT_313034 [Microthyrium microscopicum]|uniref:C2H2-type domain-containing protein n=1 Tax=Microthyrium microscopicum TaxID=703497 RepID=A0A6A6U4W3_9PEZI|nr:hypothetical protein BT63DRAFT_313034 [Microthyrium microscopicum]
MMTGTSPSTFHQPSSFQSSSYLPKMEANYFRDYFCCGKVHSNMHVLMQHREEAHGERLEDMLNEQQFYGGLSFPRQQSIPHASRSNPQAGPSSSGQVTHGFQATSNAPQSGLATIQDDPVDSMDFDENTLLPQLPASTMASQNFGQQQPLPTAPTPHAFSLMSNNPTVSSVNTPTLSTHPSTLQNADSSIPTTPLADNMNIGFQPNLDMFGMMDPNGLAPGMGPLMPDNNFDFGMQMGLQNDISGLTIHDPAKQLQTKNGTLDATQLQYAALTNGQFMISDDVVRAIQLAQPGIALPGAIFTMPGPDPKKYACPVVGCEKAYKNQNGLKYHKTHGHQNQKLSDNGDGSFSIVDPLTSAPYPGTLGMEKEKPYRCETCGKRYKNLNGLKYHRQHSPGCNPDLPAPLPGGLITLQQLQNLPKAGVPLS